MKKEKTHVLYKKGYEILKQFNQAMKLNQVCILNKFPIWNQSSHTFTTCSQYIH